MMADFWREERVRKEEKEKKEKVKIFKQRGDSGVMLVFIPHPPYYK